MRTNHVCGKLMFNINMKILLLTENPNFWNFSSCLLDLCKSYFTNYHTFLFNLVVQYNENCIWGLLQFFKNWIHLQAIPEMKMNKCFSLRLFGLQYLFQAVSISFRIVRRHFRSYNHLHTSMEGPNIPKKYLVWSD